MPSLAPLSDIFEYHVDAEAAIRLYYSSHNPSYQARFTGYFRSEVDSELAERLGETERRSALIVLARVEAAFRIDYKARAISKGTDQISISFRKLYSEKSDRARLSEDILEIWRHNLDPDGRSTIGQLRGMLRYRHWLAHGRYWHPGAHHTFQDVYLVASIILTGFPFLA